MLYKYPGEGDIISKSSRKKYHTNQHGRAGVLTKGKEYFLLFCERWTLKGKAFSARHPKKMIENTKALSPMMNLFLETQRGKLSVVTAKTVQAKGVPQWLDYWQIALCRCLSWQFMKRTMPILKKPLIDAINKEQCYNDTQFLNNLD